MFDAMNVSASGLSAQRVRMDVIAANIANANTTKGRLVNGEWQPYQRKMVEFAAIPSKEGFSGFLDRAMGKGSSGIGGVEVSRIREDETPFAEIYQPGHPQADENGMVKLPNVDILKENADLLSVVRSYEANVTAFNASKTMLSKALEIGRR